MNYLLLVTNTSHLLINLGQLSYYRATSVELVNKLIKCTCILWHNST